MSAYIPPFEYNARIVSLVAEVSELVGQVTVFDGLDPNPVLRRDNQIRTIHSSLLIENNALTLEQVTAVLDGKHVLAPPKDVREVQNAYEAYEVAAKLDPYSLDDLLAAHGLMMDGLVKHPGCLRNDGVGVYAGDELIHAAPPHSVVPQLMGDLFEWLRSSNDHPLIKGSVFHYEFEFIHPFMDGNGRTGRLWHSLLLRAWRPVFAWMPVETLIHRNQQEYYDAILAATNAGSSTPFIEFILGIIHKALVEVLNKQQLQGGEDADGERAAAIERRLAAMGGDRAAIERCLGAIGGIDRLWIVIRMCDANGSISASETSKKLGLGPTRTREILGELVRMGVLAKHGNGRYTRYSLVGAD